MSAAAVASVDPLPEPIQLPTRTAPRTLVEIVVPVHNEERVLERSVSSLHRYLTARFPLAWRITIADNASNDGTWAVAQRLCALLPHVWAVRLDRKGRGLALRTVWSQSDADVVAYMDVDLSTDLDALLPLVAPLVSGHSDLAIGSRLSRGAKVIRGPKREVISRCYNLVLRLALRARFDDAQCGFKAGRAGTIQALLAVVEDDGWFFDTELLVAAQRTGLRIHEVPVDWIDDPDSRVDVWSTAVDDLKGVWRVLRNRRTPELPGHRPPLPDGMAGQLVPFAAIGVICTGLYAVGYNVLRAPLGPWMANAVALTLTMLLNTAANRRYTFGHRGPERRVRHYVESSAVYLIGLLVSTAALGLARLVSGSPGRILDTVALLGAGLLATVIRFVGMRNWVFNAKRG